MIEILCTSCHTRYRIDERGLPDEAPTFKCSRCGHVFTADAGRLKAKGSSGTSEAPVRPEAVGGETTQKSKPPAAQSARQYPSIRPLASVGPTPLAGAGTPAGNPDSAGPQEGASQGEPPSRTSYAVASEASSTPFAGAFSAAEAGAPSDSPEVAAIQSDNREPDPTGSFSGAVDPRNPAIASGAKDERVPSDEDFTEQRFEAQQPDSGETLSFDFHDDSLEIEPEQEESEHVAAEDWKVDDDESGQEVRFAEPDPLKTVSAPAPPADKMRPRPIAENHLASPVLRRPLDDSVDLFLERGHYHSAGFFLAMFFLTAVLFAGASLVICGAPVASARMLRGFPLIGAELETPPSIESEVAVGNVRAYYKQIKGGRTAFVIVGRVTNRSATPLHVVRIGVRVMDPAQHDLAARSVYCGQTLSERMIAEMTPHELEFLQKLHPQKSFVLDPSQSAPFVTVFIDPPGNVASFAVAVTQATPAEVETASNSGARP